MKTVKDTQYLISETTREIESLKKSIIENEKVTKTGTFSEVQSSWKKIKSFKKEIKKKIERIKFLRDIISYLESDPREVYLKIQEEKLQYRIAQVDEKIAVLRDISKAPGALANQIKSVKAEFNYDKHKRQLDVIQFILN
jgi:TolA-binding protein